MKKPTINNLPALITVLTLLLTNAAWAQVPQSPDLASLDENSDGKISHAEFEAYAETRLSGFDQMELFSSKVDANSDGNITQDEFDNRMEILERINAGEFDEMDEPEQPKTETSDSKKKPKSVAAAKDQSGVTDVFKKHTSRKTIGMLLPN